MPPADIPGHKPAAWGTTEPACSDLTLASVFRIDDLDHLESLYNSSKSGFIYARDGHPNARRLGELLAELEGAEAGLVVSSGMAAIAALVLDRVRSGDRILASRELYGKTHGLLTERLARLGVTAELVDASDLAAVRAGLARKPKLFWVESLSNPFVRAARIDVLADLARSFQVPFAVDATFTPPPMLKPISLGSDIVMHSLTKIISGHADVTLGSLVGANALIDPVRTTASFLGHHASAFDCWQAEKGMSTLDLRYERAAANAMSLGLELASKSNVKTVHFPGLESHPDHSWLERHANGFGYMLAFEIDGGRAAVNKLFAAFQMVHFCPSLGDVRTTVSHPALTSHRALTPGERAELGIRDGLVRVSVGIESFDSIREDFDRALSSCAH